jgi:hypothetical protein
MTSHRCSAMMLPLGRRHQAKKLPILVCLMKMISFPLLRQEKEKSQVMTRSSKLPRKARGLANLLSKQATKTITLSRHLRQLSRI